MTSISIAALIPAGISFDSAFNGNIVQMILHAGPMVKFVMLVLFLFSIGTWAIIFLKFRVLRKARDETDDFLELFYESRDIKKIYMTSQSMKHSPWHGFSARAMRNSRDSEKFRPVTWMPYRRLTPPGNRTFHCALSRPSWTT